MTTSQITALEWALPLLPEHPNRDVLADLLSAEIQSQRTFHPTPGFFNFMRKWGLTIPLCEILLWRLLPPRKQEFGHINGLPGSRGQLMATDGIQCYIELQGNVPSLYLGHLAWFIPDKRVAIQKMKRKNKGKDYLGGLFAKE